LFANSPRLENDLSDSTEVGGIDFRARNNFSSLTGSWSCFLQKICDDAAPWMQHDSLIPESLKCYLEVTGLQ
jgi:hypothetical protein